MTQINVEYDSEYGFGRPAVIYYENNYLMFYSIRDLNSKEYRLGLAKSDDGKKWLRCDDELNLNISENFYEKKHYVRISFCNQRSAMFFTMAMILEKMELRWRD